MGLVVCGDGEHSRDGGEHHGQDGGHGRAARPADQHRPLRPQKLSRRQFRRRMRRLVLADQRLRIGADGPGDGTNVPAGIEVTTAVARVTTLNAADDRFPDPGSLPDLGHG